MCCSGAYLHNRRGRGGSDTRLRGDEPKRGFAHGNYFIRTALRITQKSLADNWNQLSVRVR